MNRDRRLAGLSAEHHHALVLARRAECGDLDPRAVRERFEREVLPHMEVEERILLLALGDDPLVRRTLDDHDRLRALARAGDTVGLARKLIEHIHFEERELFPACEERLPAEVLEAVANGATCAAAHDPR